MDPCFEAPDFEGPHSLTSTPSKSQQFIKFALVQVQSLLAPSLPRHNHCFLLRNLIVVVNLFCQPRFKTS